MAQVQEETTVIIVGAGPAGLAASACLTKKNVPNIILEREDIYAPLWKRKAYDRLRLHLSKQFCELPHLPYPSKAPTYIPKEGFIKYLDTYVSSFGINPLYHRNVVSASYDHGKWIVTAENIEEESTEKYTAKFLVVATGENSEGRIPRIPGLDTFVGETLHTIEYSNGKRFENKNVLVVGSGNSGMEIAYDLYNWGANSSIVIRSPVHVFVDDHIRIGMELLALGVPLETVDSIVTLLGETKYGDLSEYGIERPSKGPFYLKKTTGRSAIIDVGTVAKIRTQDIKVFPAIERINGKNVDFTNGDSKSFDALIFATGFNSTVLKWLKDDGGLFGENGMPRNKNPNHWRGEKGIYCTGFASAGLWGINIDAQNIANDISDILNIN